MTHTARLRARILVSCAAFALLAACGDDSGDQAQQPMAMDHGAAAAPVPLYTDLGGWTHKIGTSDPQAQAYFDQGVRFLFGFNHAEAIRSFEEAARHDEDCAMCWWGVAFAYGPNINMPMMPDAASPAIAAVEKATELALYANSAEQAYIAAIAKRYSSDPNADRAQLDKDFAAAMKGLAASLPDDPDAQTFYVEALMDTSPWNYWEKGGTQMHPGLEDIIPTLERTMARWPDHPGAKHLYIHAVEASADPKRGEAAADALHPMMPGMGHVVHMPGHIYNRIGRYEDALKVNIEAEAADEKFASDSGQHGLYSKMYYIHNMQFGTTAATNDGQSAVAIAQARKALANLDYAAAEHVPMVENATQIAQLTLLRFGKYGDVLSEPMPGANMHLSLAIYHYARARAYVGRDDMIGASGEQAELKKFHNDPVLDRFIPFGVPAKEIVALADKIVEGDIARRNKDWDAAIAAYTAAAAMEDALPYTEPPYWDFPVRNTLGATLLEAGKPAEAEAAFTESLKTWPTNGWALFGLMKAQEAQGKTDEAAATKAAFDTAWARADTTPDLARY